MTMNTLIQVVLAMVAFAVLHMVVHRLGFV